MTNTINNVPRELLEDCLIAARGPINGNLSERLRAILSAPSPAGVDGLEVVGYVSQDDIKWQGDCTLRIKPYSDYTIPLCRLSEAQAIIDGLRGEVAAQEETANQWRELALQFDRHRMTAMAHIRAAASGDKSAIEALGVFAALPPIPGHEITAEFDKQAQRIGELASHLEFAITMLTVAGLAGNDQVEAMRAALSAGKERE